MHTRTIVKTGVRGDITEKNNWDANLKIKLIGWEVRVMQAVEIFRREVLAI